MKKIVLTGGGTAGHVTPNLALLPALQKEQFEIVYIGSENGMEKKLVEDVHIPYYGIATGKLRRYISKQNISDMFRVVKGVGQASKLLKRLQPDVVFSKGGFVAVPVVLAAKKQGIPVIVHESDITPGLANKIAMPFAKIVCTTFPETLRYIPKNKGIHTGTPIRQTLFEGKKETGISLCGFTGEKPILLQMGGSLGAVKLNDTLRACLSELLQTFDIIHLCGKGHIAPELEHMVGYKQFEYVSDELPDLLAAADIIVSRAGSNAISEFFALQKPHLLIPLSAKASRGDQILNAASYEKQGFAMVLQEEYLTPSTLQAQIQELYHNRTHYCAAMRNATQNNGIDAVMKQILKFAK